MLTTHQQHARATLVTTIVAIMVIAGVVVLADHLRAKDTMAVTTQLSAADTTSTAPVTTTPTTSTDTSAASTNGVKDGTYSASTSYSVPHGQETIGVNLTLQNGVVTKVSIQNSEGDRDSAFYQEEFASGYKSQVVGKKISGLQISIISGASDTTDGFNSALSRIASQAQA